MQEEREVSNDIVGPGVRLMSQLNALDNNEAIKKLGVPKIDFIRDFMEKLALDRFNEEEYRKSAPK